MKFIITAATLSSLVLGASANQHSISSLVTSSNRGFFGVTDESAKQGWNIATTIRGGSTGGLCIISSSALKECIGTGLF